MIKQAKNNRGFTIMELMIASMVFSVILLLVTTGVVRIGRSYYKGVLQSRTQETARNIIDELSRGIQFSGQTVKGTLAATAYGVGVPYYDDVQKGQQYGFCIGGIAYSYLMDMQLVQTVTDGGTDQRRAVLTSYPFDPGCEAYNASFVITPAMVKSIGDGAAPPPGITVSSYKELLGIGMRLTALNVVDNLNGTFTITVGIASGEMDLFVDNINNVTGAPGTDGIIDSCNSAAGNQFCAASRLTTTVQKRIQ